MNKNKKPLLFLLLFFVGYFSIYSQNKKQPLIDILSVIENKFKISFSYADADINDISIIYYDKKNLDSTLYWLEKETKLVFNKINNEFISISKLKKKSINSLQELEEVVISNYLTTGIFKNIGSISIKPKQFGILPGLIEPDVLQTIKALPGVTSIDETISNINIRGGTHDQNLILYDGIKMYQSGHFFGLISVFNPYLTKKVSVYKNGTSAKYGDGISSIIDMQLSDSLSLKQSGGVGINLINIDGFATLPLSKKIELQIAARRSVTDIVNTPTYKAYSERIFQDTDLTNDNNSISKNENFYFYDVSLKLLYDLSKKDKIRFNFLNIYNALNYDEQRIENSFNQVSESKLKQKSLASGLNYKRIWNSNLTTTAQFYFSNYDLDATNFDILNNQRLIQKNTVIDAGIKLETTYNINKQFRINAGFQFSEIGISNLEDVNNPLFRSNIKRVIRSNAGFIEMNFLSKNKNTLLKMGVRDNYYSKFNLHIIEPRLLVSQKFLDDFRVEFSGEFKSQSTSQIIDLQKDFLGIEKRRWVLANNETIPIIKSKQTSLGLSYNKNKLLINAEAYLKQVDGITSRSQGFVNQFQFKNAIGSYQIKGLDLLISKQINNKFKSWLSYSFSNNQYTFNTLNNGVKFPNNIDIKHVINFANTYTLKNLKIGLGLNWHSGRPFTSIDNNIPITNNSINYQTPNIERLEDYLRVDFSSTYQFKIANKNAVLGASLWNVLNKKNNINSYYVLENENISQVKNVSLGLTPNLSFRIYF